jgi:hypothetical protein
MSLVDHAGLTKLVVVLNTEPMRASAIGSDACHPRNSRSTRLRDGPAFFTARFTLAFDYPVFFAEY